MRFRGIPFWSLVDKTGDCWLWTGYVDRGGYGRYGRHGYSHRIAYEELVAQIPPGLVIDHLCRVRHCVNPTHMEPVTDRVNVVERGTGLAAQRAVQTHCIHGHEFTPENTRVHSHSGTRYCRICDVLAQRVKWARNKDEYNARRRMRRAGAPRI